MAGIPHFPSVFNKGTCNWECTSLVKQLTAFTIVSAELVYFHSFHTLYLESRCYSIYLDVFLFVLSRLDLFCIHLGTDVTSIPCTLPCCLFSQLSENQLQVVHSHFGVTLLTTAPGKREEERWAFNVVMKPYAPCCHHIRECVFSQSV